MKIKLLKADGSLDSYLNITDVVNSNLYSVATIKRKSDSKIFKCYARNGRIQINRPCHKSWFINDEDYEELDELCTGFNQYLKDLNLSDEAKSKIIPKNEMEVILNSDHPLKQNGFHSALLLHFDQFIAKMQAIAAS